MSRFAFVSALTGQPWGGSEELWSRSADDLKQRGHEIFANVHWWPEVPRPLQALEAAGIPVTRRRIRERERMLWGQRAENKLYRWLDEVKPDVVVICLDSQSAGSKWMRACRERNLPYVLVVQAVVETLWPGDAINQELREGYAAARRVFYLSQGNLRWLQTQFADGLPNAERVFNPFNVSPGVRLEWPAPTTTLRLACVGRLDPVAKGHDILFEVLGSEKWKSRDVSLSLFGRGGYEKSLRALADYRGLNNVEFAGVTSNIEDVWRHHHALALPSRFEGLPLVVVEAMFCGRPCIVTDVAGNAEVLEDNVSGFVAAAPKAEFFDEALERLWQAWENGDLVEFGKRAGIHIRGIVPHNPAAQFATQLESIS